MKIAIGTVQFGLKYGISNEGGTVDIDTINKILNVSKQHKIDMLDTAQAYGNSESQIGCSSSKGFNIITKLMPGIKANEILASIHKSINNLDQDNLHGLLFHDFKDYMDNPDSYKILQDIRSNGLVRKIGFSLYFPGELEMLLKNDVDFDILQIPFNIFDQRFLGYFNELKKRDVEIHVRSAFLQGLVFLEPYELSVHFNNYKGLFTSFQKKVNDTNLSVAEVCLNYLNLFPQIDYVVLGITTEEELKANINSIKTLSNDEKKMIQNFDIFKISDENIILPFNWK
jgi:aryl-alcohol dehydrogenase-like predicted oxidoreductase